MRRTAMPWVNWLLASKIRVYAFVFFLMILSSILMVPAAQTGAKEWIWLLLGVFIFANVIVLWMK
jgi:hypothetical protein